MEIEKLENENLQNLISEYEGVLEEKEKEISNLKN